jgi:hypothetical protein
MARYYFHVIDGKFLVDDEGTECRGITDVREQAIATAGAILRDSAEDFPAAQNGRCMSPMTGT